MLISPKTFWEQTTDKAIPAFVKLDPTDSSQPYPARINCVTVSLSHIFLSALSLLYVHPKKVNMFKIETSLNPFQQVKVEWKNHF